MRSVLGVLMVGSLMLVWASSARPGEEGEARTIVAKAIKAAGGEAKLAKFNASTFKEKGTYYGMGKGLPYTGKYAVQWPDKFRMEIENTFTLVLNGNMGWIKTGNETKEMTKEEFAAQHTTMQAEWVASLLPLQDKAFTLTTLTEIKVADKPALGIKVTRKDFPEVKLYFDKTTNLLVKTEYKTKSAEQGFKEVTIEAYYSNYSEIEGAMMPSKTAVNQDGKLYVEAEMLELRPAAKLDDKLFSKP
jgi:hypothetical protein